MQGRKIARIVIPPDRLQAFSKKIERPFSCRLVLSSGFERENHRKKHKGARFWRVRETVGLHRRNTITEVTSGIIVRNGSGCATQNLVNDRATSANPRQINVRQPVAGFVMISRACRSAGIDIEAA